MEKFTAKWISNRDFYALTPINVFHKEMDVAKVEVDPAYGNKHILFRKKVTVPEFFRAKLRISADDYYKLYINGEFVTQGPAPGYPFHYYYNEIDVTKFLVPGENTIAVHTYYQGLLNRVWVSADLRHGLVLDLYADGNKLCESDESWKCAYHTGYTACGKFGYDTAYAENYDAGSPEYAFALPAFDDSAWEYAKFKTADDHELFLQPTQQLDIYDVKPASLTKTAVGYMADFGFEAVGYLKFAATGKKGDVIVMHYAEELADDGSLRWKMRCNCDYEEKFTLSGREGDVLSQYDYKAFRYA